MERSPSSETTSFSSSQEILRISNKPNVDYLLHKSQPLVPILSQFNPISVTTTFFLKIILILPHHLGLRLQSGVFPSSHPTKTLDAPLLSPTSTTCPAQIISSFDNVNDIW